MREPRRLTTLWAFTACYRDSFTFLPFVWGTRARSLSANFSYVLGNALFAVYKGTPVLV
jgi:hypothetical protein